MTEYYYRLTETTYSRGCDEYGDPLPGPGDTRVNVELYEVLRHTPCGVVIRTHDIEGSGERFISKHWNKQFALPTLEEAVKSYKARKARQKQILQAQIQRIDDALVKLELYGINNKYVLENKAPWVTDQQPA